MEGIGGVAELCASARLCRGLTRRALSAAANRVCVPLGVGVCVCVCVWCSGDALGAEPSSAEFSAEQRPAVDVESSVRSRREAGEP